MLGCFGFRFLGRGRPGGPTDYDRTEFLVVLLFFIITITRRFQLVGALPQAPDLGAEPPLVCCGDSISTKFSINIFNGVKVVGRTS